MKPVENWKKVVQYAWSFRINVLLAVASGIEGAVSYLADGRLSTALFVFGLSAFAAVSRVVAQVSVSGPDA